MRTPASIMLIAVPLALAACDSGEEAEMPMAADDMPMATEEMPMAEGMAMNGGEAMAQPVEAEGTITAIDNEAGTITIDHGPVPAVDWPAMTMGFTADPGLRERVEVGDQVKFQFRQTASGGEITSIEGS